MKLIRGGLLSIILALAGLVTLDLCVVGQSGGVVSGSQYFCGDGLLQETYPSCGNNIIDAGEGCDDGVGNGIICSALYGESCTYCSPECTSVNVKGPTCGDGIKNGGEECDDGNQNNDDACTNICKNAVCGDGIKNNGEECDIGPTNGTLCSPGNGSCTFCSESCVFVELIGKRCGDGVLDEGEECDDGNKNNDDLCSALCTIAVCGDGQINNKESCDDGENNGNMCFPGDGSCTYCSSMCDLVTLVAPICGDGVLDEGEECDDGNSFNSDGCLSTCKKPTCGDGIVSSQEQCDEGVNNGKVCSPNGFACTYCSAGCQKITLQPVVCGDGKIEGTETCDDGNTEDGDGCTFDCMIEPSYLLDTGGGISPLAFPRQEISVPISFGGNEPIILPITLPSTGPSSVGLYGPVPSGVFFK